MLKTNELRIGNLVSQNGFFGYVYSIESALPRQEERFSDKDLVTLFDNGITTVPIEEIKPIKLTIEWLKKFRFYEVSNSDKLYYQNNSLRFTISRNGNIYYNRVLIESVHRFQNLHFALTGVELELSSNVA